MTRLYEARIALAILKAQAIHEESYVRKPSTKLVVAGQEIEFPNGYYAKDHMQSICEALGEVYDKEEGTKSFGFLIYLLNQSCWNDAQHWAMHTLGIQIPDSEDVADFSIAVTNAEAQLNNAVGHTPKEDLDQMSLYELVGVLGRAAYFAMDDCETRDDEEGKEITVVDDVSWGELGAVLDKIESLGIEVEGLVMGPGAILQEALHRHELVIRREARVQLAHKLLTYSGDTLRDTLRRIIDSE